MNRSFLIFGVLLLGALTSCVSDPFGGDTNVDPTVNNPKNENLPSASISLSTKREILEFAHFETGPYLIGPGDTLRLKSFNKDYADEDVRVAPDGTINVASNAQVVVAGKDVPTAEKEINLLLSKRFENVEIKLELVVAQNRKVTVLGDVRTPGLVLMDSDLTLLDAIAKVGGFPGAANELDSNVNATRLECRVVRDNGKSVWIDLNKILFQNEPSYNLLLKSNDIIYVYRHF